MFDAAEELLHTVAAAVQTEVTAIRVIMVNGVGHYGRPCVLVDLVKTLPWDVRYNPDLHSALQIRIPDPDDLEDGKPTTVMVQPTGAIQIMGARSVETVHRCHKAVVEALRLSGDADRQDF